MWAPYVRWWATAQPPAAWRGCDVFTQGPAGAKVVGVRTRSPLHAALWMAIAMIGCGSSADSGPAAQTGAGGTITSGTAGAGGSDTAIVTPGDASAITSESGSSVDAADPVTHNDDAALDAGPKAFVHPGILVNRAQLDFVK